jgi:hypothetical protein
MGKIVRPAATPSWGRRGRKLFVLLTSAESRQLVCALNCARPCFTALLLAALVCAAVHVRAAAATPISPAAPAPAPVTTTPLAAIDSTKCYGPFRSESFLEVAAALQALPETQRVAQLRAWATTRSPQGNNFHESEYELQVIVLCRMLFEPKPGQTFRRAALGSPTFVGEDSWFMNRTVAEIERAWPLEPITIVEGIPFSISHIALLAGAAERAESYLNYCIANLSWTSRRYAPATVEARQKALDQLLHQHPWSRPLNNGEIKSLTEQIESYESPPLRITDVQTSGSAPGGGYVSSKTSGRMTLGDKLTVVVAGGSRPYHYAVTHESTGGSVTELIAQGEGQANVGDPFRSEPITVPWPNPAPVFGDQLVVTVKDAKGAQMVQVLKVVSPREVDIARPTANPAALPQRP